ncbi:hypothetical protein [Shimia sp. Alg240-R146]|uniref:hypothetical protein n=1 Tax=Shimia sp. Alg240-R146 TaxID=2993449 RepID=UPI0022E8CE08|nr:hypothetical protein [Shimia sp. Alg240-R146]
MAINLEGITFKQINAQTTGAAQGGDEFVSFQNTGADLKDLSGWQVWAVSTGSSGLVLGQNGLAHEFAKATFLAPNEPLWVVTELSQDKYWEHVASEVEIGQNALCAGAQDERIEGAIALVNPDTGEYIVFNIAEASPAFYNLPGFPGTAKTGEIAGAAMQQESNAGISYHYQAA